MAANPIVKIDPLGLIIWKGKVQIHDAGAILGGALLTAELKSECIDGEQYTVFVEAALAGLNFGIIPVGSSESNETLDDGLPSVDPYIFEGFAGIGVVSAQVKNGYGVSDIKLGGARTPTPKGRNANFGKTTGFGEGILGMIGRSWLRGQPFVTSCECQ